MIIDEVVSGDGARSWNKLADLKDRGMKITDPMLNSTDELRGGRNRAFGSGVG
jgi:hypothetical protein